MYCFFKISKIQLFYIFILLLLVSCHSNSKIENNLIQEFQEQLIKDETTGSNVAMVFKDDEVVDKQVVNSGKREIKILMMIQYSLFGQ